jgi:hypothetical protein
MTNDARYRVMDNDEIIGVFNTYREAAVFLRGIEEEDAKWEKYGFSIDEIRSRPEEEIQQ